MVPPAVIVQPLLVFGPFVLDPVQRVLLHDGATVKLGKREMDLLIVLVEHASEVLSHACLETTVWPSNMVEDSNLRARVAGLRKALGDGVGEARYIINVPGRGYSFVGALSRRSLSGADSLPPAGAIAGAQVAHL